MPTCAFKKRKQKCWYVNYLEHTSDSAVMETVKAPMFKADAAVTAICSVGAVWYEQVPIHRFNYSWGLISQAAICLSAFPGG